MSTELGVVGYVLLNAECDVIRLEKINFLCFASIIDLFFFLKNSEKNNNSEKKKDILNNLLKHKLNEDYFLPPDPLISNNGSIIEFSNITSFPLLFKEENNIKDKDQVLNKNRNESYIYLLNKRMHTMKPEWRTHFAYRLSTFFGRIGIPYFETSNSKKTNKEWITDTIAIIK